MRGIVRIRLVLTVWALFALVATLPRGLYAVEPLVGYAAFLKTNGITADTSGLNHFFRRLHPSEKQKAEVARLIGELGGETFVGREAAMRTLAQQPLLPREALTKALASPDFEIRWRVKKILNTATDQRVFLMHAAFKLIEQNKITGVSAQLFQCIPLCDKEYLSDAAIRALEISVTKQDSAIIEKHLKHEEALIRVAAIRALAQVKGTQCRKQVEPFLTDKDARIRLASALVLANFGERKAVPILINLLSSKAIRIRIASMRILRAASGKSFGYIAYQPTEQRRLAIGQWELWWKKNSAVAKLKHPLSYATARVGRILVCVQSRNKVIELDKDGKTIWEHKPILTCWTGIGLPNGHRLLTSFKDQQFIEIDAKGKVIDSVSGLPGSPFNLQRLENGNTLVACTDSQMVVEYKQDKSIAWKMRVVGRPMDVQRLENGRTMITLQNKGQVIEMDRLGRVFWKLEGLSSPLVGRRMPNGNTLVAEVNTGRILEFDRSKQLVWEFRVSDSAYHAQRLDDGNTLITTSKRILLVDQLKKIVWQKNVPGIAQATRY